MNPSKTRGVMSDVFGLTLSNDEATKEERHQNEQEGSNIRKH